MLIIWTGRLTSGAAVLVWMGLIFYLSSLSQDEASRPLETPAIAWLGVVRSYAAHVVLYGVLSSLVLASLWAWRSDYRIRWAIAAAVFSGLYGVSDEYHQSLVSGRAGSAEDVVVNALGAITAAVGLRLVLEKWRGRGAGRRGRPTP